MNYLKRINVIVLVVLLTVSVAGAADWPQFRGPTRDGLSPETGLLKKWPAAGPKELWSVDGLGVGFSSVAVADGTIYTTGLIDKEGILFAFDLKGNLKWKVSYGPEWTGSHPGVHSTPTVDGDRLYLMSGMGRIACHNAATGEHIWHRDTLREFSGKNIRWGIAESVLIEGEKAICTPGGRGASVVALDKMSGKTIWTSKGLGEPSGYCAPIAVDAGSKRLVLTLLQQSLVGIDINSGKVLWTHPHKVRYDINAVTPAYDNGLIYVTNGYRQGGHMFELAADGTSIKRKWSEKSLDVHHGGVVLVDGCIHGASTNGTWSCLDPATGNVRFSDKLVGKGSVIYVDGLMYGYGENGKVGLIKINPDGYEMISSFQVTKGTAEHWGHPAISDGRLYIRHGEVLMCYDIRQ